MDCPSSSVGFPLSGNAQSHENSPPLPSSSTGISLSENLRSSGSLLPPLLSSSSPVGIPLPESPQSTEHPPILQLSENGPPTIIITDEQWNEELADLYNSEWFFDLMTTGDCEDPFLVWYECMKDYVERDRDWDDCAELAGAVRDCVIGDLDYHQPLFEFFLTREFED